MNPLQQIKNARERRKINRIAFSALEGVDLSNQGFEDCNELRRLLTKDLNDAGFETTTVRVTSSPSNLYLGHTVRPNQSEHEIVGVRLGVIDPLYPKVMPQDRYLKRVYQPENGVELIIQHA